MQTALTDDPLEAAAVLRSGRLVAFPTETVYGLGADAFNPRAVRRIFAAKGRPLDNPLIVHVADPAQIGRLTKNLPPAARTLVAACFPGPLSIVARKAAAVPDVVTAGLDTVAVRMPRHAVALRFLAACATPVAAPSANLSGRPSPTSWQAVFEDLRGSVDCVLRDGRSETGLESTVVDCSTAPPVVLRAGAISVERLRALVPELKVHGAGAAEAPRSPGVRHRHYAPRARVEIVAHPRSRGAGGARAYIGLERPGPAAGYAMTQTCASTEEYAHALFDFFRLSEAAGVGVIDCQAVELHGLGLALMDRLEKAARATA